MKKILILLLMAAFSISSYAQLNDSTHRESVKKDYLRKSRNQRTTGFILLGVGAALTLTGAIMINNAQDDTIDQVLVKGTSGAGIATIGIISGAASIPFFILSINNNKRAKNVNVGLKMEKLLQEKIKTTYPTYYPSVTASYRF